ncbi:MAG: SRPBCC domain-containing protein [Phenylobacterium sp.]
MKPVRAPPMFGMKGGGPKSFSPTPPPRIEHRIGVQAPPEILWELLSNLEGWADWNPLYPQARGAIRIGSQLELIEALPGRARREARPIVLEWVPLEQIHWRDSRSDGWVKSVRFIEVDIVSPTGCIISNGEIFSGWLARRHLKAHGAAHREGFRAMNEALVDRAVRLWAERGGPPPGSS